MDFRGYMTLSEDGEKACLKQFFDLIQVIFTNIRESAVCRTAGRGTVREFRGLKDTRESWARYRLSA